MNGRMDNRTRARVLHAHAGVLEGHVMNVDMESPHPMTMQMFDLLAATSLIAGILAELLDEMADDAEAQSSPG